MTAIAWCEQCCAPLGEGFCDLCCIARGDDPCEDMDFDGGGLPMTVTRPVSQQAATRQARLVPQRSAPLAQQSCAPVVMEGQASAATTVVPRPVDVAPQTLLQALPPALVVAAPVAAGWALLLRHLPAVALPLLVAAASAARRATHRATAGSAGASLAVWWVILFAGRIVCRCCGRPGH